MVPQQLTCSKLGSLGSLVIFRPRNKQIFSQLDNLSERLIPYIYVIETRVSIRCSEQMANIICYLYFAECSQLP